jgi:hypothetical protein
MRCGRMKEGETLQVGNRLCVVARSEYEPLLDRIE